MARFHSSNNYILCVLIIRYKQLFIVITDTFVLTSIILCFLFTLSFVYFLSFFLSFYWIEFSVSTLSPSICSEIIHSIFIPLGHILQFSTFRIEC